MDYGFIKSDLVLLAKCESCSKEADHVLVVLKGIAIGVFQICYECSIGFQEEEYRIIPKQNAERRNEKCTPKCNPRK